jgi:hypothetical protein
LQLGQLQLLVLQGELGAAGLVGGVRFRGGQVILGGLQLDLRLGQLAHDIVVLQLGQHGAHFHHIVALDVHHLDPTILPEKEGFLDAGRDAAGEFHHVHHLAPLDGVGGLFGHRRGGDRRRRGAAAPRRGRGGPLAGRRDRIAAAGHRQRYQDHQQGKHNERILADIHPFSLCSLVERQRATRHGAWSVARARLSRFDQTNNVPLLGRHTVYLSYTIVRRWYHPLGKIPGVAAGGRWAQGFSALPGRGSTPIHSQPTAAP